MRIGIVDSGVDTSQVDACDGAWIRDSNHIIEGLEAAVDRIGHGTACAHLVKRLAPAAELIIVKVVDTSWTASAEALELALDYLLQQNVAIVNMSIGIPDPADAGRLASACARAAEQGVILVAANGNEERARACPAVFESVIGVDAGDLRDERAFYYRGTGEGINVVAAGRRSLLPWVNPSKTLVGGTSFACARLTGLLAGWANGGAGLSAIAVKEFLANNSIEEDPPLIHEDVPHVKKGNAKNTRSRCPDFDELTGRRFVQRIRRAVLYPFNKELHGLLWFRNRLSFEVKAVVDFVGMRRIGKDALSCLGMPPCGITISGSLVKELEQADTLILGDLGEYESIARRSIFGTILEQAASRGINVFSMVPVNPEKHGTILRTFRRNGAFCYAPVVDRLRLSVLNEAYPPERRSVKPVAIVLGTSPQQGKFTTQLSLRYALEDRGYKVGHITTEPQGELFGADVAFPFGYSSQTNIFLPMDSYISYVRSAIGYIESKDVDITLCGGQSGTLQQDFETFYPLSTLPSLALLMGALPDICILVVNSIDEIDYVKKTIQTIENMSGTRVVCLVLDSRRKNVRSVGNREFVSTTQMSPDELDEEAARFEQAVGLPVVSVAGDEGVARLSRVVIESL